MELILSRFTPHPCSLISLFTAKTRLGTTTRPLPPAIATLRRYEIGRHSLGHTRRWVVSRREFLIFVNGKIEVSDKELSIIFVPSYDFRGRGTKH